MRFGAADPCALYTGPDYDRCRRFHVETRREMTQYRAAEVGGLILVGLGTVTGLGLLGALVYGVYDAAKQD